MFTERPLSRHRMAVHDLILRSKRDHASIGGTFEWDVTDTLARLERDRSKGRDVGLAAFMVKATAEVLREHPRLNSRLFRRWFRLREVRWDQISCNLVVAREDDSGTTILLPAVIRNADQMTVEEIHLLIRRWKNEGLANLDEARAIDRVRKAPRIAVRLYNWMVRRSPSFYIARHGTYALSMVSDDEVRGVGGQAFSPFTSFYPGSIAVKPAVVDGEVVARRLIAFGMLVDHYLIDGLQLLAAAKDLKRLVEEPDRLLGPE